MRSSSPSRKELYMVPMSKTALRCRWELTKALDGNRLETNAGSKQMSQLNNEVVEVEVCWLSPEVQQPSRVYLGMPTVCGPPSGYMISRQPLPGRDPNATHRCIHRFTISSFEKEDARGNDWLEAVAV